VYGSEIAITLLAESDASDIVGVTARYRPRGPDRISVYSYPAFTPGRSITATLSIKTGDGAYFPPGTVFDIYFEITDSAGNVLQTEPQTVEYLDPSFSWKRLTRGGLTAVYYNLQDDAVARLMDAAASALPALILMTGAPAGQEYKAVLYRTVAEATSSFPRVSETATDRQFFAGFAQPEYGLFVLGAPEEGSFKHELTHLLVAAAVTSPLAGPVPAWLNEGLAVWAEGDGLGTLNSRIRSAATGGRLLRIRSMGALPGTRSAISLFYPQSGAFAGYLHQRFGAEGIAALLKSINEGRKVHDAALNVWGVSLDDIENDWRISLGAQALPTPTTELAATPTLSPEGVPAPSPEPADALSPTPASFEPSRPAENQRRFPAWALFLVVGAAGLAIGALAGRIRLAWRRRGN
jgi:hypothetical protein